jgi:hypothetical protein
MVRRQGCGGSEAGDCPPRTSSSFGGRWHQLFPAPQLGSNFSILQKPPLATAMIFLCAWLSYRFIERRFIPWGHRLAPPLTEGRDDLVNRAHEN